MPSQKNNKAVSQSSSPAKTKTTAVNDSISKPVREFWEQLGWPDIAEVFGDRTTERGRRYGEGGNVRSLWATTDGKMLLAIVSGEHDYKTLVTLEDGRKKKFVIFSDCSCPVGTSCKHGVATMTRFLDCLAKEKLVPLCVQVNDETWETYTTDGKKSLLKIDFGEYVEDDDDWDDEDEDWDDEDEDWDDEDEDWDDEDEDWDDEDEEPVSLPRRRIHQIAASVATKKKNKDKTALNEKLSQRSKEELVALILQFHDDCTEVREYFEQEAFVETLSKTSDIDKLVRKAIKLINSGIDVDSYPHYHRYSDGPSLDLDPVEEVVKQFKRFDDPLPGLDKIARYLIEKGTEYVENNHHVESTGEIDSVFFKMAEVLIASKALPVKTILWAYEISGIGDYDLCGYGVKKILEHAWPAKTWSGVADVLLEQFHRTPPKERYWGQFRTVVETLDKAGRQNEATDFLRQEAASTGEAVMLVDRLIASNHLAEAKKIAIQKRAEELKAEQDRRFHRHDTWPDKLKTIAEKQKDWPVLASIQASELFETPSRRTVATLMKTAKIMKIETVIRSSIEKFLSTGILPSAIAKSLEGKKTTPSERKLWPIPFFEVRKEDYSRKN
ncbi:MAG: hypothetical protein FWC43_13190, partial [Planctomycetaceae bacterium]|nr:hypothetical protein [Planctomycetaceae bacterium]